jgi:phosphotriesterase-related protein
MQETILAVDRPLLSSGSMTEGRIQTVTGAIEPGALGRTSIHEHLMLELDRVAFQPVDTAEGRALAEEPVSLATRWWVRQRWTSVRDNLRLTDETMAVAEVARFAAVGGGTIADPTTEGIGRDPAALVRISLATGVRIVMGAGYYVHASHPAWIEAAPESAIVERIVGDLTDGVGPDRIRAGFIGEVGCSWPLTPRERRVLRAAGIAQRETGVPLMVHPGRNRAAPSEIVDELEDVGADLERTAICHLERTFSRPEEFVELGRRGVWLCLDCFGLETSFYPLNPAAVMPNDGARLVIAEAVIEAGLGDRLLFAQDICQKHRLAAFGGHGYDHLLRNVAPTLVARGHTPAAAEALVTVNPARFLAWAGAG